MKPTVCPWCLPLPSELHRPEEDLGGGVLQEPESYRITDYACGGLPESHDPGVLIPRLGVVRGGGWTGRHMLALFHSALGVVEDTASFI